MGGGTPGAAHRRCGLVVAQASGNGSSNDNSLPKPLAWLATLFGGGLHKRNSPKGDPQQSPQQQRHGQQSDPSSEEELEGGGPAADTPDGFPSTVQEPGFATNMSGNPDEPVRVSRDPPPPPPPQGRFINVRRCCFSLKAT